MERIAFFDAKPYDRIYFDKLNRDFELVYFESRLRPESVKLAEGCRAVIGFDAHRPQQLAELTHYSAARSMLEELGIPIVEELSLV